MNDRADVPAAASDEEAKLPAWPSPEQFAAEMDQDEKDDPFGDVDPDRDIVAELRRMAADMRAELSRLRS